MNILVWGKYQAITTEITAPENPKASEILHLGVNLIGIKERENWVGRRKLQFKHSKSSLNVVDRF